MRDIQINPFTNEILVGGLKSITETTAIPSSANYPTESPNMFVVFLTEIPFLEDITNFPIIVKNASETITFTKVNTEPISNYQYRVAPIGSLRPNAIQFYSGDAGMSIKIWYYGWGSVSDYSNLLKIDQNLNDLQNKATARTNLDVYSKNESNNLYLSKGNNLSDLANIPTARGNLDVYSRSEITNMMNVYKYTGTTPENSNPVTIGQAPTGVTRNNSIPLMAVQYNGGFSNYFFAASTLWEVYLEYTAPYTYLKYRIIHSSYYNQNYVILLVRKYS